MSESEGESSTIHASRSVSRSKRRKIMKVRSSSEESDSDRQNPPVSKKSRVSSKCVSSDDDLQLTPIKCKDIQKTPATRSSDRLKVKNSKEFRVPTRKEVLDKVSPGILKCPRSSEQKIKELKPRRLINNFIRERNSYTADRAIDIYETDSELSDFINDDDDDDDDDDDNGESEESQSDQSLTVSSSKDLSNTKRTSRKDNVCDSDSDDDFDKSRRKGRKSMGVPEQKRKNNVKPSKTNFKGKCRIMRTRTQKASTMRNKIDSDESYSSSYNTDEDVPLSTFLSKTPNLVKKKKVISSSSESESEVNTIQKYNTNSENDGKSFTKLKDYPARPISTRRMKLNEKRQEYHSKTYGKLMKKRKEAKLGSKDPTLKEAKIDAAVEMSEELNESQDKIEILKELIEKCNKSDESDKEFVVTDDEVSDSEVVSDQEQDVKFLKLINDYSQTTTDDDEETLSLPLSGFSVQSRRKGKRLNNSSKWRRINTRVESGDSSDSESVRKDYDRKCQLHTAVNQNDIDLVKAILQQDPSSIFDVGYRKRSVLHLAALNGNADMVKLLLNMNSDCEQLDKYRFPPIVYAANHGNSECLEVFLRHTDMKKVNKRLLQTPSRMSLLHFVVGETRTGEKCNERGNCLELLLVDGNNYCIKMIEHRDARRRTPLEAAVYASQHQCVAILLKHGADPLSFRTKDEGNLLHFAVECASHLKHISDDDIDTSLCLRQLVEPMALCLNETDTYGFTPLMYACESGNCECASVLIQAGAKVMTKDSYGTSPLHLAAMAGSTECVNLLLSNGHSVDCVDNCGWPPLLYANFKAQEECVLALMKPKPNQLFVLGHLLKKQRNEEEKTKTLKVVKNVLFSLANHDAYYTVFNDFIRVNPVLLDEYNHGLLQHTWRAILDFDNKQKWFKRKLNLLRNGFHCSSINLRVKRDDILGSTMHQIGHLHGKNLRSSMGVVFENEPGICTGPKREFFACLSKDVVGPNRGLFEMSDDSQFSPAPYAYFVKYVSSHPTTLITNQNSSHQDTKTIVKTKEDVFQQMDLECTDSELLAADYSVSNDHSDDALFNTVEKIDCTDSELVSALETAANSGFSTASQTRSRTIPAGCESSTTVSLSSTLSMPSGITCVTDAPAANVTALNTDRVIQEDRRLKGSSSDSQKDKAISTKDKSTWISCLGKNGKDMVIHSIALRSKLKQLRFLGRLVGAAICQDMLLNLNLSKHFVKQVLGIPLCHPDDLSSFDYQLHQNMVTWIQENSVGELELPFGVDAKNPWTDQLVPVYFSDDVDKTVDDSNKHEYIKLVSQYKLQTFIEREVEEFRIGLYEVIPRDFLALFTADEFSLLMNGVMKIDVKDWKENTKYAGFTSNDEVITWFWDIVSRLKEEEKALLLKFSTGSPSVPIGGFGSLQGISGQNKFTITKLFGSNKIPEASTCFNMLKLTAYDNEKQLREKLLIAIRHGSEGFSFS